MKLFGFAVATKHTPNPTGFTGSNLFSVPCPADNICAAVGTLKASLGVCISTAGLDGVGLTGISHMSQDGNPRRGAQRLTRVVMEFPLPVTLGCRSFMEG